MKELQMIFNYEDSTIYTIIEDDNFWFSAKDVATILGYSATSAMLKRLKSKQQRIDTFHNGTTYIKRTLITESGLYTAVLGSKLQTAELFKSWIVDEVLPSIRKTGTYSVVQQPQFDIPKTLPEALRMCADQIEKNELLLIENKQQQIVIEEQQPKVDYYDTVTASNKSVDMSVVAKTLDMGYGRNNLYKLLREYEVVDVNNIPYQRYLNTKRKRFEVVQSMYNTNSDTFTRYTMKVFPLGIDFIRKLILKEKKGMKKC